MNKLTVKDIEVKGKKCLVRVDFNVPMKDGVITDENRINGALPTIKYLMENGAKVILCSHMGKPHNIFNEKIKLNKKEKKAVDALPENEREEATKAYLEKAKKDIKKFTLKPVADRLNEILGANIGTCFSVIIAASNKPAEARRVAFFNIAFNIVGALVLFLPLSLFKGKISSWFMSFSGSIEREIANFHTLFNMLVTIMLLPVLKPFTRLICAIIKDKPPKEAKNGIGNTVNVYKYDNIV